MADSLTVYKQRLTAFQKRLLPDQAALISKPTNITYFTGFPQLAPAEREAFLLITPQSAVLLHHSFSPTLPPTDWLKSIPKVAFTELQGALKKIKTLLVDQETLTMAEHRQLTQAFGGTLQPLTSQWVEQLRAIKDAQELSLMKTAGHIAAQAFATVSKKIRSGLTEREIATMIGIELLREGAQEPAFPVIVAFGANAALPHHQPTDLKLKPETPILLDFGARYQGYCSDMTRTMWFGKKPSTTFQKVEKIVQRAYELALQKVTHRSATLTAHNVDEAARQYITDRRYADQFIHTTGHGLGLEIHEPPSLSWQNNSRLKTGMILTIEPGIYLVGELGYRHENTVALTKHGARILTI